MIPIRNLYAIIAYAMRDLNVVDDHFLGACNFAKPDEVLARLFEAACTRALRRGVDRRYESHEESGPRPTGALDPSRTARELLLPRGRVGYVVDELTADTPNNRLLRTALQVVLRIERLPASTRRRLQNSDRVIRAARTLSHREVVAPLPPPRDRRGYAAALYLARLICAAEFIDKGGSDSVRGWAALKEELPMIFEGFVRGFAKHHLGAGFKVSAKRLEWPGLIATAEVEEHLPGMRTDVTIETPNGGLSVIECKFYENPLKPKQFGDGTTLRNAHLYQLLAYLHAAEARYGRKPRGLILYAGDQMEFDLTCEISGCPVRATSVGLAASWEELRAHLDALLQWSVGEITSLQPS